MTNTIAINFSFSTLKYYAIFIKIMHQFLYVKINYEKTKLTRKMIYGGEIMKSSL